MVYVPPEIRDMIIGYLWYDPAALKKCSTVCRTWLPRSRLHSFHTIVIAGDNQYARLERVVVVSPAICDFVRCITFKGVFRNSYPGDGLFRVLQMLSRVEEVALQDCEEVEALVDWDGDISSYFPMVRSFRLLKGEILGNSWTVGFPRVYDGYRVRRILAECPKLRAVHFAGVQLSHPTAGVGPLDAAPEGNTGASRQLDIHDLTLSYDPTQITPGVPPPLSWLFAPPLRLQLQTLALTWCNKSSPTPLGVTDQELLCNSKNSLEELTLLCPQSVFHVYDLPSPPEMFLDLAQNSRLTSLKLIVPWITGSYVSDPGPEIAAWIKGFHSQLTMNTASLTRLTLVEIELKIEYASVKERGILGPVGYCSDWVPIDSQLAALAVDCNTGCGAKRRIEVVFKVNLVHHDILDVPSSYIRRWIAARLQLFCDCPSSRLDVIYCSSQASLKASGMT
ncbi:hypothetical protein SCP_1700610 [Sparassis crispa]|uniref:F-box domain-containing protein n=1 Tax=Sparassis crispa TaxID=139825 RepID=A0A401H5M2_9APHY|nr:hypothetical protein SCP_1700610 [Sparassis crispa]GBE89736.1 hypothetical protein SCP_1700610 [Sparassis crispa]